MLDIYHYTDYRLFIGDYFQEKKKLNPAFSHQYFSRKAAIKSKGFMLHVIKGQRNLTRPVMLRVAKALGLNKQQTRYFDDLVTFCQAKTIGDKEFYYNKLAEFRKAAKITNLDDRGYEFFNEWYHTVIRELIPLHKGIINPVALAKKLVPAIGAAQVKQSLRLMEELGIIRKNASGKYAQTEAFLHAGGPVRNLAIVKFQKEMIGLAQTAWERLKEKEVSMHTMTLSMSEELSKTIENEIDLFKLKIIELVAAEKKDAEQVYQMNINYFPVSIKIQGDKP